MVERSTLTCIDLFAGAGGLSEGFRKAGFSILAANDFDKYAAETCKLNHPETAFLEGRIEDLTASDFLNAARLRAGELDCLIGGPPCQAFSVYNHQRGMHDDRSGLFREYIRLVAGLKPKFIVMENVTGMTSVEEGLAVKEIHTQLGELGYHMEHRILKAEIFGVPQERRRLFFIGTRLNTHIKWPEPTHFSGHEYAKGRLGYVTIWEAIGDLPELKVNEGAEEQDYISEPQSDYQKLIREGSKKLYNHVAPALSNINLERLKYISPGGSWRDIPVQLLPAGMKKARRCDHTKRYGRLRPDGLACTILTKCDPHWGAYFHPTQDRTLTVREAARLQSFPDRYVFYGPRGEQYRQVGNAVPPLVACAVGRELSVALLQESDGEVTACAG